LADRDIKLNENKFAQLISDRDIFFIKNYSNKSTSEKLQLLALRLVILLWEEEDSEEINSMLKKLNLIDELRHELSFFRAEYYKKIFEKKSGLLF
jgi:hypothetical protein